MLTIYQTGVDYHFWNALGLFVVAFMIYLTNDTKVIIAGYIMLFSIFIFSGSLFVLSLTGMKWLGAITPIGGVGFIIAWGMIAFCAYKFSVK